MEMGGGEPQKDSIIAEFSKSEGNLDSPDTVKSNRKIRNDMNRTTKMFHGNIDADCIS